MENVWNTIRRLAIEAQSAEDQWDTNKAVEKLAEAVRLIAEAQAPELFGAPAGEWRESKKV